MKFLARVYVSAKHAPRFAFRRKVWNECVHTVRQKVLCKLLYAPDSGAMSSWMLVVAFAAPVVDNAARKDCCVGISFAKEAVDSFQHERLCVVYVAERSFPLYKGGTVILKVAAEINLLVHVIPPLGRERTRAGP